MTEKTGWESFKAESATLGERIKELIHEGNVRRVVIEHERRSVAEFPLTAGVIGLIAAPVVAAVCAAAGLLKDCTIHVERGVPAEPAVPPAAAAAPPPADAKS